MVTSTITLTRINKVPRSSPQLSIRIIDMAPTSGEERRAVGNQHDEASHDETPLLRRDTDASQDDKTKFSIGFLIALTCINGGLQVFFSTVMANLAVGGMIFSN